MSGGALPGQVGANSERVGQGEMPMENADGPQAMPSAPPTGEMAKIAGYERIVNPDVRFVPPPPSYDQATSGNTANLGELNIKITEDEARQLIVAHAKSQACWGTGAAEDMTLKRMERTTAVHYVFRTFQESRSTDWVSQPYKGQPVDGPENGPAPQPWEIQIRDPKMFSDTTMNCEVPHTAFVRVCHMCQGAKLVMCLRCMGWGRIRCGMCHGRGHRGFGDDRRRCFRCHGTGKCWCRNCRAMGQIPCPTCEATGQVKCYVQMTINFRTHTKDFILEHTALPDHFVRNVLGTTIFEDTQPLLNPVQTFPEQQVNAQSAQIVQEHRGLAQTGRIRMQNHYIKGVPVFQCDCQWKDKEFQFFVYGHDRKVYSADYPQTCCCGCQLL